MTEYERVRKEIAEKLADWDGWPLDRLTETDDLAISIEPSQSTYYKMADQILSLVEIKADDQSLQPPESISFELNPEFCGDTLMVSPMGIALKDNLLNAYKQAQEDVRKAGFIKVIPKPKRK